MRLRSIWIVLGMLCSGAIQAQEIDLQVKLMGPLSTQSSRKGDRVFAQVVGPEQFKGDTVEGKVNNVRAGGKIRGESVLSFSFETLQHRGEPIPIASQVKSITNSKGRADVDEEGRAVRKTNNVGKAAAGAGAGGLIGGIIGGGKGALIGAGAGAVASVVFIEFATDGPEIRLDPGSAVTLSAQSRSGPSLAGLAPSASPSASAGPEAAAANRPAAAPASSPSAPAQSAAASVNQPDLATVKADFIPGEKTIFYDDFSDMAGDEPPPHWKVRGAGLALKAGGGIRQLTATGKSTLIPNLKTLPKNFTVETEVKFDNPGDLRSVWSFFPKGATDNEALQLWTQTHSESLIVKVTVKGETVGEAVPSADFNQPVKQALWIQNGRMRFYVNGQKVVDVNQVDLPPIETTQLLAELYGDGSAIGYRQVRIAESTPDFGQVISSSGRYVTHGILFDTDSDRVKPESAPVIKSIAQGLEKNPNLKLRIEGHTDSVGNSDHNLDLSKRRAAAVKAILVSQFNLDASRLTTDGLGATKPIDSNDTPQGRAQNRRVELVRQ